MILGFVAKEAIFILLEKSNMRAGKEFIRPSANFIAPSTWHRIKTIDLHTGGEPLRVILDGFPEIKEKSVLDARRYVQQHHDHLRQALMFEPRGHADMYGCLLVPPNDEGADFGILFLHNGGYSTMCGHAIIAISTLAVEMGWVETTHPETKLEIDAPCGRITAYAKIEKGQVSNVRFHGVPSFVLLDNGEIEVPGIGLVRFDLAYGGAFYAYVEAAPLGLSLEPESISELITKGMAIKRAIMASDIAVQHPFEVDLSFLYGTIFMDESPTPGVDSRNVCIFAEGEVDRCPTGSGVAGRMALHWSQGRLQEGQSMYIESITGSVFRGTVNQLLDYGSMPAVIPEVEGNAFITGQHEFLINPQDPFKNGFFLR